MRDEAVAAAEAVEQVQQEPRGVIRVACPITLAQSTVGRVIPLFVARYPQVRVEMRVSNRVVDLIEEGVDVALRVRTTLEDSGSLVVKSLGRTETVLVATPQLLERQARPQQVEDLESLEAVSMSAVDGRTTLRLLGPGGAQKQVVLRTRYVADDLLTVKSAVMQGIGVALLPDYMCSESLANGRLVEVLPGWAPPSGVVHAVFPSRRGLVPAVRRFLDFLGEHVRGEHMEFGSGA